MLLPDDTIANLLQSQQFLTAEQLTKARQLSAEKKISLYDALLQADLLTDEHLGELVADYLHLPFIQLDKIAIPAEILQLIPESFAKNQKVIAFEQNGQGVKVATDSPENKEAIAYLGKKLNSTIIPYFASPREISQALKLYKKDLQKVLNSLLSQPIADPASSSTSALPIIELVDTLIEYAFEEKVSDIHLEPHQEESVVRFRIDGVLHDVARMPKRVHDPIISRIKVMAKLRTDEHLSAQDGKLQVNLVDDQLDIRVSVVPVVEGEKGVLRLLSRSQQFSLQDLGISEADLSRIEKGYSKPFGMILSTGPTGSGKTTSIYTILKILNTRERNIATIEDPVEYEIDGVNQIHVNPKTNLTFASGLRAILRQDPNIIFVGEIRDNETASIAVNAAMTGHLVLSTLHTNNAATSLPRLIDMGIEPFLAATTVNIIIGQRLIRKICEKCRVSETISTTNLSKSFPAEMVKKYFGGAKQVTIYRGKGCPVCHSTGFVGRVGIFEILEISEKIRKLITQKADAEDLIKQAVEDGMITMLEDGLAKVQQGITTSEEVMRAVAE